MITALLFVAKLSGAMEHSLGVNLRKPNLKLDHRLRYPIGNTRMA